MRPTSDWWEESVGEEYCICVNFVHGCGHQLSPKWLIFWRSRQLLKNKFFDSSTPKRKVDKVGKQTGWETMGSGTVGCDTLTHKDHFTVILFQSYFI